MKIFLSKKDYRALIDMVYIADWVMHSHIVNLDDKDNDYKTLRKKILSYYKEMGLDNLFEYSSKDDDYYEMRNYEDEIHEKFIDPYDNETFWDELMDKLAVRDLIRQIGWERYEAMKGIDRAMELEKIQETYSKEFEQYGLDRVNIDLRSKKL